MVSIGLKDVIMCIYDMVIWWLYQDKLHGAIVTYYIQYDEVIWVYNMWHDFLIWIYDVW